MNDVPSNYSTFRAAAELARGRWGVIGLGQLRALGVPDTTVRDWVAAGRLVRLHRGVYAVGHDALVARGRWLAAVMACGEGAALSHASAAALHDLRGSSAALVDVSVPSSRRRRRGIRVHRPMALPASDVTVVDGIVATTPTRTVIDMARVLPSDRLETLVAAAERRGLLDFDRLARARSRALATITGRGAKPTRSRDERRLLAALRAAELPEPETNPWLTHGNGEEWQPDVLFRRERVIVEVDDDSHRTAAAFELDRHKDAVRQADGYRTLRFTRRQIAADRHRVVAIIASLLRNVE